MHRRIIVLAIGLMVGIGLALSGAADVATPLSPNNTAAPLFEQKEPLVTPDNINPPIMGEVDGWGAPYQLTAGTQSHYNYYGFQNTVTSDAAGNVYCVYYDYLTTYSRVGFRKWTRATSTWSAETLISAAGQSFYHYSPSIAVDNSNNIHITWYVNSTGNYGIWYKKFTAATSTWSNDTLLVPSGTYSVYYPSIAAQPGGNNVHIVWRGYTVTSPSYYDVQHITWNGTSWSTVSIVDTGYYSSPYAACDVDAANNCYVAYTQPHYPTSTSYPRLWARVRNSGGAWGNVEQVSEAWANLKYSYMPDIEVSPAGVAHVVWYGYNFSSTTPYRIYYRSRSTGGVWGTLDTVSEALSTYSSYYADGFAGQRHRVRGLAGLNTANPSYYQIMCRRKAAGSWGAVEAPAGHTTVYNYYPCIHADNYGSVNVAWYDTYLGNADVWYLRRTPDVPNDVGIAAILSPGTAVSGRNFPIVPAALVRNFGLSPQTNFAVRCTVFGAANEIRFTGSQTVTSLNAGDTVTVSFGNWTPTVYEQVTVKMATALGGDQNTTNDVMTQATTLARPFYTGGPDLENYWWIDSDTTGGPTYAWKDIRATGTAIVFYSYDDGGTAIPVGFTFQYRGNDFTSINVNTNGHLNFGTGTSTLTNSRLPATGRPTTSSPRSGTTCTARRSATSPTRCSGRRPTARLSCRGTTSATTARRPSDSVAQLPGRCSREGGDVIVQYKARRRSTRRATTATARPSAARTRPARSASSTSTATARATCYPGAGNLLSRQPGHPVLPLGARQRHGV